MTNDVEYLITFRSGNEEGRLIRPCKCKGSVAYVHPDCLQQWTQQSGAEVHWNSCQEARLSSIAYHQFFTPKNRYNIELYQDLSRVSVILES